LIFKLTNQIVPCSERIEPAIAERAVKLHGGNLRALNRPNGGATIQMRLPVIESKLGKQPGETRQAPPQSIAKGA
jgi:hypothetical protein